MAGTKPGGGSTSKKSGRKSVTLKVDTAIAAATAAAAVTSGGPSSTRSAASPNPAQDTHPYARGAVIEVWHIPKKNVEEEEWWWTESEEEPEPSESENNANNTNNNDGNNTPNNNTPSNSTPNNSNAKRPTKSSNRTVRLCDIIDRSQTINAAGAVEYRYYVHYRDFNRRMDEWITTDRIVSPPSVGNAKARFLKREEERLKRKRKEEKQSLVDLSAPRTSRRRSSVATPGTATAAKAATAATSSAKAPTTTTEEGETTGRRQRRISRRKSMEIDDAVTVPTANSTDAGDINDDDTVLHGTSNKKTAALMDHKKEILELPTDGVTTQTVGDGHVLATLHAVELDEHEGLDEQSLREHEEVTKVKNVNFLELGQYQMETWYFSPLPKELIGPSGFIEVLYACEFTLNLFATREELLRCQARLPVQDRHPPGDEIYRKGNLSMFEVDAQQETIYCQNLSYIAKLFLDHKTLYFSVSPFLFYVLCEVDDRGYHPVGYFSKEKYSDVGYNLACILTFPAHQRKGYGRFLISFSYELSKLEDKVGSPEKPMSDLGQQAYKPYWTSTIIDFLLNQSTECSMSIMDISKRTSIMAEDIVFTLNQLSLLKMINGVYFVTSDRELLETLAKKYPIKEPTVDPTKLHWTPFLTDVKRDKFSIHSKKPSVEED